MANESMQTALAALAGIMVLRTADLATEYAIKNAYALFVIGTAACVGALSLTLVKNSWMRPQQ